MSNLPRLEKAILDSSKKDFMFKSFLGIGLFSVAMASGNILTNTFLSSVAFATLPYIVHSFKKRKKIQKNLYTSFDDVSNHFYKKSFEKQFEQYLRESSSLTEQKYKLIMLHLWLSHKVIKLNEIYPQGLETIGEIADKILENKESKYDLYYLFNNTKSYRYNNKEEKKKQEFNTYDLIKEDFFEHEKLEVAQQVYEEYANIGLLGKQFQYIGFEKFLTISSLQGYELTNKDIKEIKKVLSQKKQDGYSLDIHRKNSTEIIPQLINAQKNTTQLSVLKNFFNNLKDYTGENYHHYVGFIDKKMKSIEFQHHLEKNLNHSEIEESPKKKI